MRSLSLLERQSPRFDLPRPPIYNAHGVALLILTRRVGERVFIVPSVILSVLESGKGTAVIEIETPLSIVLLPESVPVRQPQPASGSKLPPVKVTRDVDETIKLGDEIEVMIVSAKTDVVKLGVKAPLHVQVLREEVYERIAAETRAAAGLDEAPELPEDLRDMFGKQSEE